MAFLLLLSACDDRGPTQPVIVSLEIAGGDGQVGAAGSTLPEPLSVRATDERDRPVPDIRIHWTFDGTSPGSATSLTDANGVATVQRTLGPNAGVHATVAAPDEAVGAGARSEARFTSIALVQGAVRMTSSPGEDGSGQVDTVLATLPSPFRVRVRDHADAPVAGVIVEWGTRGGGTLSGATSTTGLDGVAEVTFTLGARARLDTVRASVPGLVGSPVQFYATTLPGAPAALLAYGDGGRLATVTSGVALEVYVSDTYDNPVPGVEVTWAVTSGDGFVYPPVGLTDEAGLATATHMLGPFEGLQTAIARTLAVPDASEVSFTATAVSALVQIVSASDDCWYYCYGYYATVPYFSPSTTLVKAGRTVAWSWDGIEEHDVVFEDDPTQPVSSPVQRAGRHMRTFSAPGSYRYRCTLHSTDFADGMVGQVIVLE